MPITNKAGFGLDYPIFEQLADGPSTLTAGMCFDDDGARYIYSLQSASNFWRFDTWNNVYQQLTSPPAGTVGAGTTIRYCSHMGSQQVGAVFGSVYALIASTGTPVFYRYDIGSNTWSAALSVTNLPASIGTDSSLALLDVAKNLFAAVATQSFTITCNAAAIVGATTVSVTALPQALPANGVINFGTSASPKWAVLTAAAAASAVSLTVSPLLTALAGTETAQWSGQGYLVTNASTQIYRYDIAANAWATTNVSAAAIPALAGAVGAGCAIRWLPGFNSARLYILRGAATSNIYYYDLGANTVTTVNSIPGTETYSTGTCVTTRADATGKPYCLIIQKDGTSRFYQFNPNTLILGGAGFSYLQQSTVVVGDKLCLIRTPDSIDILYHFLSSRTWTSRAVLPTRDF